MMRLVIDIYDGEDTQGTKEAVAMLLEPLGRVRVVSVIICANRHSDKCHRRKGRKAMKGESTVPVLYPMGVYTFAFACVHCASARKKADLSRRKGEQ